MSYQLFPRVFENIMDNVRDEYDVAGVKPIYEFGTYLELTKVAKLNDLNRAVKYPLVWLVWEASESRKAWVNSSTYTLSPRIFICNSTKSEYSSDYRYTNNFEAILYPIWDLIKKYSSNSTSVNSYSVKDFETWEHLFWGESLGMNKRENKLFDTLDALEIKINELKISPSC